MTQTNQEAYQWLYSYVTKTKLLAHVERLKMFSFQKSLTKLQFVVKSECRYFYNWGLFLSN